MSYNYHPVSGVCDINDSDHIQDPNDLVKQDGYIYVGTEVRKSIYIQFNGYI